MRRIRQVSALEVDQSLNRPIGTQTAEEALQRAGVDPLQALRNYFAGLQRDPNISPAEKAAGFRQAATGRLDESQIRAGEAQLLGEAGTAVAADPRAFYRPGTRAPQRYSDGGPQGYTPGGPVGGAIIPAAQARPQQDLRWVAAAAAGGFGLGGVLASHAANRRSQEIAQQLAAQQQTQALYAQVSYDPRFGQPSTPIYNY